MYAPHGGPVNDESAPLYAIAPPPFDRSVEAVLALERATAATEGIEGVILRFGWWYGPGTTYASDGFTADQVRKQALGAPPPRRIPSWRQGFREALG